jgi:hypothetical protein
MLSKNIHGSFPVSTSRTCLLVHFGLLFFLLLLDSHTPSWLGHIRTHSANIVTLFWSLAEGGASHAHAVAETPHRPFESLANVQTQTKEQKSLDGVHPSTRTTASLRVFHRDARVCQKCACSERCADFTASEAWLLDEVRRTPKRSSTRLYRERCECSQPHNPLVHDTVSSTSATVEHCPSLRTRRPSQFSHWSQQASLFAAFNS